MKTIVDDRSFWQRWTEHSQGPYSLSAMLPTADGSLKELRTRVTEREVAILASLSEEEKLHALRLVVLPVSEESDRPRILVNSVSDDDYVAHVARVARVLAPHLDGLVDIEEANADDLAGLIQSHRIVENTLFLASAGVSLVQIRQEARLREHLRDWMEARRQAGELDCMEPDAMRLAMRNHVLQLQDASCVQGPAPGRPGKTQRTLDFILTFIGFPFIGVLGKDIWEAVLDIEDTVKRILMFSLMCLGWLFAFPFVAIAFLGVRFAELIESDVVAAPASVDKLDHIEAIEDSRRKNELTVWFPVKKGFLGRFLMRIVLLGADMGGRHIWTKGRLAGAQNIHFARLIQVDRGQRMIFMSDYEGSFDAYVNHFIGVGGHTRAVIPISSRVHGCPKTRWLYFPENVVGFRRGWRQMARSYQLQAGVRYVAYGALSANDILSHRIIREGLFAESLTRMALN